MRKQNRMRTYQNVAVTDYPTAHITINKSRIKNYPYNQIFMADGQEFQIELDNCTNFVWLAEISVNGEKVSKSGLVLKPGEHVFLDTPDIGSSGKKHKFKFETYEIEQGRSHLVANNGKVKIDFYKERSLPQWINYPVYPYRYTYWYDTDVNIGYRGNYYYNDIDGHTGDVIQGGGGSVTISNASHEASFTSKPVGGEQSLGKSVQCSLPMPTEETGRVEKGSKSKQKFHKTNYDFESFSSYTEEFQIYPLSKRVVNIQEATREYCPQCGKRRKKNHAFCPKCGTRF